MKFKHHFILVFLLLLSLVTFSQQGVVTIESSPEIKALIAKKIAHNRTNYAIDGYRIQLFYGSEKGVKSANVKFNSLFPEYPSYINYDSPDWKIRVGNFRTRLAADRALQKIILEFGDAIVINHKISG